MHISLFSKVTYEIQILLKKIHILYSFSLKVTFSMSKVNFWIFGFIETKRLNIDLFTNENWSKFNCHRSVVSRRKEKNFVVNKVLYIISYKNAKARALSHLENVNTFCDNLEQAVA